MGSRSSVRLPSVAECREELRVVLSSRVFRQAENLSRLLEYVCEKALLGEAGSVTEYTIAVDVFGKPRAFRDSRDSSVRVDVHRLRKRLALFYTQEGASHALRIVIPPGSYVPDFQVCQAPPVVASPFKEAGNGESNAAGSAVSDGSAIPNAREKADAELPPLPAGRPVRLRPILAVSAIGLIIVAAALWLVLRHDRATPPIVAFHAIIASAPATNQEVHILAGFSGAAWTDAAGHLWQSDRYFTGGLPRPGRKLLRSAPPDRRLFQTMREAAADDPSVDGPAFSYDIPMRPGTYELRLYFADPLTELPPAQETDDNQNTRRFIVSANGRPLLEQFDPVADAEYADVDVRAFKDIAPGPDGKLHLDFTAQPHRPFVNAIELVPSRPGHANAIRIAARPSPYTDPGGKTWEPDNFFVRGRQARHPLSEAARDLPELLRSERYGNFSYSIPVPPGSYTLTLYFAETLFSPLAPSLFCRGPGCRVFDVSCNGTSLLRDFDIYQSGGAFRPVVRKFSGLRPNGQGKLLVSFSSSINYAEVRALEVVDEAP
ncbi:MAG: malectin domain-containing carbohydrate-binding protein [Bryobacteraceae bacterium]|jgi:hypothetical protein